MGQRIFPGFFLLALSAIPFVTQAVIAITETQALSFSTAVAGTASTIVTAPGDANAAVFNATGDASTAVTATIVEASVNISTGADSGPTERITVSSWTFGGSLTDGGGSGSATFDISGQLTNLRIGATANVEANDVAGSYSGSVTLRVVYQ